MKYAKILILLLILTSFYFVLNTETADNISQLTTKSILEFNTKATSVVASLLINVDADAPKIYITSPRNKTYNHNETISLNFTIVESNLDKIFYYISNSIANITITGNTTFSVNSTEAYTLILYANDTFRRLNSSSVTFSINLSKGHDVDFVEFQGGGETTDFSSINITLMQNLSGVKIEKVDPIAGKTVAKIIFVSTINISREINLSEHVNISFNRIEIKSENIPEFNKSAVLEIHNLTFSNPRVLKDVSVCPSTICQINGYINGTLSFNVTGFSTYSSEETPIETLSPGGGTTGGSGGGGGSNKETETYSIKLFDESVKFKLKQDSKMSYFLKIENTGNTKLNLKLKIEPEIGFLFIEDSLNEYKLDIEAGEKKNIEIKASGKDAKEGVYVSKLIIEGINIKEIIPVIAEIESGGEGLFDLEVNIPYENKIVEPGKKVMGNILLFNLGGIGKIKTDIEYNILDLDGNIIANENETEIVETGLQKSKEIRLPEDIKKGKYIFSVKISYFDGVKQRVSTSTALFEIGEKESASFGLSLYILIGVLLLIIITLSLLHYHLLKRFLAYRKKRMLKKRR